MSLFSQPIRNLPPRSPPRPRAATCCLFWSPCQLRCSRDKEALVGFGSQQICCELLLHHCPNLTTAVASAGASTCPGNASEFQVEEGENGVAVNCDNLGSLHRSTNACHFHQAKNRFLRLCTWYPQHLPKSNINTQGKGLTRRTSNAEWTRFTSLLFQIT